MRINIYIHVVDVVHQPSAFEVTRGSTAINSHPTQLNVSWRDRIVVVVFDRLPKLYLLSQDGVLQRRLNLGSHKQRHVIAQGL